MKTKKILILGGGLAGLTTALHLLKCGYEVVVLEKNEFPRHKVCGEYVSNEVLPYLNQLNIDPFQWGAVAIDELQCSTQRGATVDVELPLGGFGISRSLLDFKLYEAVSAAGGSVIHEQVEHVSFKGEYFSVQTLSDLEFEASIVVGAYGKRSNIDVALKRNFMEKKSPWLGIKAHYEGDWKTSRVGLYNFEGGYCGISKVEDNRINVCYMTTIESFQQYKNIDIFQEKVLRKNRVLDAFFDQAKPIFDRPLSIGQISFDAKSRVENHVLMCGDSASLIHPLCGNGMAMAILGARLLGEHIDDHIKKRTTRQELETGYDRAWTHQFQSRLKWGRRLQKILTHEKAADCGISALRHTPWLFKQIIKTTHGKKLAS